MSRIAAFILWTLALLVAFIYATASRGLPGLVFWLAVALSAGRIIDWLREELQAR